jgi:predicted nucleic-acid-binding protein
MVAVDTNVVVRLLTDDDLAQTARAKALFVSEEIFISKTVVLESEWVLRKLYQIERVAVLKALSGLTALPNVRCEDQPTLTDALAWAGQGMDFADALHLASSRGAGAFATFDRQMIKRAHAVGQTNVLEA